MKVLVTGGTGVLGQVIVAAANAQDLHLRLLSRRSRPADLAENVEWASADLATGEGLPQAVLGIDAVIHAASHPRRPDEVDVQGTRRLLEAAPRARLPQVIYVSIVGIDQIPYGYYARKLSAEALITDAGVPYSVLCREASIILAALRR